MLTALITMAVGNPPILLPLQILYLNLLMHTFPALGLTLERASPEAVSYTHLDVYKRQIIDNAACEPHVRDLCDFLNQMGACIEGIGSNRLMIQGVARLHGTEFRIGSDFMEVGSFIGAAAVTRGEIRIRDAQPRNLGTVSYTHLDVYKRQGQGARPGRSAMAGANQ